MRENSAAAKPPTLEVILTAPIAAKTAGGRRRAAAVVAAGAAPRGGAWSWCEEYSKGMPNPNMYVWRKPLQQFPATSSSRLGAVKGFPASKAKRQSGIDIYHRTALFSKASERLLRARTAGTCCMQT